MGGDRIGSMLRAPDIPGNSTDSMLRTPGVHNLVKGNPPEWIAPPTSQRQHSLAEKTAKHDSLARCSSVCDVKWKLAPVGIAKRRKSDRRPQGASVVCEVVNLQSSSSKKNWADPNSAKSMIFNPLGMRRTSLEIVPSTTRAEGGGDGGATATRVTRDIW